MEKDKFVLWQYEGWWLFEPNLEFLPTLVQKRDIVGRCFGWPPDQECWYQSTSNLETVYEFPRDESPRPAS